MLLLIDFNFLYYEYEEQNTTKNDYIIVDINDKDRLIRKKGRQNP